MAKLTAERAAVEAKLADPAIYQMGLPILGICYGQQLLVKQLGGTYHSCQVKDIGFKADIIIECTGVTSVISQCMTQLAGDGILCMAGLSYPGAMQSVDMGALNKEIVMSNQVMFGTVNANRKHWEMAEQSLQKADPKWLAQLISRREPLSQWQNAIVRQPNDIKVVIDFTA